LTETRSEDNTSSTPVDWDQGRQRICNKRKEGCQTSRFYRTGVLWETTRETKPQRPFLQKAEIYYASGLREDVFSKL
jgi:hypothetical protein